MNLLNMHMLQSSLIMHQEVPETWVPVTVGSNVSVAMSGAACECWLGTVDPISADSAFFTIPRRTSLAEILVSLVHDVRVMHPWLKVHLGPGRNLAQKA